MVTFDTSLQVLARSLVEQGVDISSDAGVFVRDIRGRLLFLSRKELTPDLVERFEATIDQQLRPFISPLGALADAAMPGAGHALGDAGYMHVEVALPQGGGLIKSIVLDRRAVGLDWLHVPDDPADGPPQLVFSSLKGGVGRSTALSVLASDLAERGYSILVVDLDLEAPGIGSMLVETSATPRFGSLDFYVEDSLQELQDDFFLDCIAASWLGGGRGRIDVVPAFGAMSLENPQQALAKLARAYLEDEDANGQQRTFLTRTQALVRRLSSLRRYDAILIDTRAGLHETTAAAMLGLGADVLLFGVDQPQTLAGYKVLLSHLAQLPVRNTELDWRYRIRMVQAKVSSADVVACYRSKSFDLFDATFYSRDAHTDLLDDVFRFSVDDSNAPHYPITILEDERYRLFDPIENREQLSRGLYQSSFDTFLQFCLERLQLVEGT